MSFYIGLSIFLVFSSYMVQYFCKSNKRRHFQAIWGGLVLLLISACRSASVGVDTPQYVNLYKYVADLSWNEVLGGRILSNIELGYKILMKLFSYISATDHFFLLWTSCLAIIPVIVLVYKYSSSPILSYLVYIFSGEFFYEIGVIRQSVAMGIVLIAIMIMIDNKGKWVFKSLVIILLAGLVHRAAYIGLVLIVIARIKNIGVKYYLITFAATIGVVFAGRPILNRILLYNSAFSIYANLEGAGAGRVVIVLCMLMFIAMNKGAFYANDKDAIWWEKMISATFIVKVFSYFFAAASRAAAIFEMSYMMTVPNAIALIDRKNKMLWIMFILGSMILLSIVGFDQRNVYVFWG